MTPSRITSDVLLASSEIFMDADSWNGLWWCRDVEDMEAVTYNAVCKSAYATWDDVAAAPDCVEFIRKFRFVLVAVPPGPEQREIAEELSARFSVYVCVPRDEAWHSCDSIRELMHLGLEKGLERLLMGCREIPVNGILNIADLPEQEPVSKNRTFSGLPLLDMLTGGFAGGELSVWTGKRGEGKSTLLSQFVPEVVAHPRKTRDGNFDADDIAGTSDLTNRANNVFRVGRIPEEKVEEMGCSAGIRILKNRRYGDLGMVKLNFDPVTRRFYQVGGSPARKFDWEVSG